MSCQSCVAAIGVVHFSVRSFGCALFYFGGIYSGWVITKDATCTEEGTKVSTCANCGSEKTMPMPLAAHEFNDPVIIKQHTISSTGLAEGTSVTHSL